MSAEPSKPAAAERRIVRRRALKKGVEISVRKGSMGLGPNLAAGGVEVSDDGVQLRVKAELKKGDEIEIGLTGIGRSKPTLLLADVRWCRPEEGKQTFLLGAQFRHRLTYDDVSRFV